MRSVVLLIEPVDDVVLLWERLIYDRTKILSYINLCNYFRK